MNYQNLPGSNPAANRDIVILYKQVGDGEPPESITSKFIDKSDTHEEVTLNAATLIPGSIYFVQYYPRNARGACSASEKFAFNR